MKKIILVAGGTGGHFFAATAIGEELISRGYEVHLITDLRCQKYIIPLPKLTFHIIDLKRYPTSSLQKIRFFIALLASVYKSIRLLYTLKASVVVGFGGYPVVSSMFAALYLRMPIIIHEQNSYLGKVNKFFAKFATKIALAYEQTKNLPNTLKNKPVITGGVVRESIRDIDEYVIARSGKATTRQSREKLVLLDNVLPDSHGAKERLTMTDSRAGDNIFRIFIFGGSQGAKIFSELLPRSIKFLIQKHPELKLHITQQAAKDDQVEIKKIYSQLNIRYELAEFFEDIAHRYQNTDLVISRAGASTIEELTYIGMPAIFIPLPIASENHQFYNAKLLEDAGAGWCMEQVGISEVKLADKILMLIKNRNMLARASKNLLKRKKEGHRLLSDLIEEVVN
nr:undecaprenyldiphospho-muramoylpentapeptide beta-N-acetylglucosaminyltransferase [Rickettsia endosymbiont of Ceutorhynchus assimilis]